MDAAPSFSMLLRRLRKSHDLSQEALAQRAACAHDTIKKLERGLRRPSRELAAHLADLFGLAGAERDAFLAAARTPIAVGQPAHVPPPDAPQPHTRRLPNPGTPFIGRVDELATLVAMVDDPAIRVISILAPGGMGKTRLALAAADLLSGEQAFADGIAFVDLTPLTSPANLDAVVAAALGLPLDPNPQRSPRTQVLDYLREKQLLLVLDNCEHLREAVRVLAGAILAEASRICLLLTTRERIGLRSEHVLGLAGLQVVSDGAILFAAIARTVQPHFALDATTTPLVEVICTRLGGMPLAIELAAGWADTLSLEAIAAEVAQGDDLLVATTADTPERHRSIRRVFKGAWTRLMPDEQRTFAQVAIFQGGATRRALQAVTGADLPTLKALVGKALLHYNVERDRYSIHELLRQYAAEQLTDDRTAERGARTRHAAYYLAALAERAPQIKGAEQLQAFDVIGKDLENVRTAWDWAVQERQWYLFTPAAITTLGYTLQWQAAYDDGLARFGAAADAVDSASEVPPLLPAILRAWQGAFAVMLGYREQAAAMLDHAWAILPPEHNDELRRKVRGFILLQQGVCVRHAGTAQSEDLLRQSITAYDTPTTHWEQSSAMVALAELLHRRRHFAAAEQLYSAALSIREAWGDRRGIAEVLHKWSQIRAERGQFNEAIRLAQRAVVIYQELGDPLSNAVGWGRLGIVQQWTGDYTGAAEALRRSLAFYHQLGDAYNIAFARIRLAVTLIQSGDHQAAQIEVDAGLPVLRRAGPNPDLGWALLVAGFTCAEAGNWNEAQAYYEASAASYRTAGARAQLGWPLLLLAHVALQHNNLVAARAYVLEVFALTDDRHIYPLEAWGTMVAARIVELYGRRDRALELYELAYRLPYFPADTAFSRQIHAHHLWRDELRAMLPPDVVAAAEDRGRQVDIWETIMLLQHEIAELEENMVE